MTTEVQPVPNTALRAARLSMRLSQDEFAGEMRVNGAPSTSKRMVQRYESGAVTHPRPASLRAMERVTHLPAAKLGFPEDVDVLVVDDGRGGHDLEVRASALPDIAGPDRSHGNYSGVWLSHYKYNSSGREQWFDNEHYVVVQQREDRLIVRSIHDPAKSLLTMDLVVDGTVVTGTWTEQTEVDGYYKGAKYHGAIQMLAEPTGRRISGKWVGFGKEMQINTGPWVLTFVDAGTDKATLAKYRQPASEAAS